MNIDELIERKKADHGDFVKSTDEFIADFFAAVEKRRRRRNRMLALAAGFAVVIGLTAGAFAVSFGEKIDMVFDPYRQLAEAVRLFHGDAAVLFVDNELVTGERQDDMVPDNFVKIVLLGARESMTLSLACSDYDSITFDSSSVSGRIVASRCDAETLILDMEIEVDGKSIRTAVPLKRSHRNYSATVDLS